MVKENIIFSTTRQWNPGDEFILKGITNLLDDLNFKYNPIIFNKSPAISKSFDFINPAKKVSLFKNTHWSNPVGMILNSFLNIDHLDNSFSRKHSKTKWVEKIIIAGTPEIFSFRHIPLVRYAHKYQIPLFLLGIGLPKDKDRLSKMRLTSGFLKEAKLILTRNTSSDLKRIQILNPHTYYTGCPALFCSRNEKIVFSKKNHKIGIIFSFPESVAGNNLNKKDFEKIVCLINSLKEYATKNNIKLHFIFHYIDELHEINNNYSYLKELQNGGDVHYSFNSESYEKIYQNFDIIISTRVHGNGLASSMGIPNIALTHDERATTVDSFKSKKFSISKVSAEELTNTVDKMIKNLPEISKDLLRNKSERKKVWLNYLKTYL
ncbi:polysaccharide pyruvyl transferase family protein [Candidatus Pacearchaeota archaeon]|nr:polysaccharide pyruvyl transferase family protein [Candidatus Pacearchaeota archaeon]